MLHNRNHHDRLRLLYLYWVQHLVVVLVLDIAIAVIGAVSEIKLVQMARLMALQAVGRYWGSCGVSRRPPVAVGSLTSHGLVKGHLYSGQLVVCIHNISRIRLCALRNSN